jgi:hypothetical protein
LLEKKKKTKRKQLAREVASPSEEYRLSRQSRRERNK